MSLTIYAPLNDDITLTPNSYMNKMATFIGFDDLDPNAEATEATHAKDLGQKMGFENFHIFQSLLPGTAQKIGNLVYTRD